MVNALLSSCTPSGTCKSMDEQLEQLIIQAQRYAPQTRERELALTRLVDEILRSRKICRPRRNQPLVGIYQEIYNQARQQLMYDIDEAINQYNPKRTSVREWVNALRSKAFRVILDDTQLKKLALEVQRHPQDTELRKYGLGELVEAIRLSGKLAYPHRANFSPQFYNLLYDEAVNKTLIYVCQKIDTYDPERGNGKFMNWVNFRLDRMIIDSCREFREPNVQDLPSLNDLEVMVQPEEPYPLFEKVREFIEEDKANIFKKEHIRNHTDANFYAIALARFSGKSWEDISEEFGISLPTLSSFFQRSCKKFRSRFKEDM